MRIKQLWILTLFTILTSNCKKDSEGPKDILQYKTWKRAISDKNLYSNPSGRILYASVLTCQKDDTYKFNLDGKLTLKKGTAKCDLVEIASENITYSYNKASKELIIGGTKYTLAEASEEQVKYYAALPSDSGSDYIVFLLE